MSDLLRYYSNQISAPHAGVPVSDASLESLPTRKQVSFSATCRCKPFEREDAPGDLRKSTNSFETTTHPHDAIFNLKDKRYAIRFFRRQRHSQLESLYLRQRIDRMWADLNKYVSTEYARWQFHYNAWQRYLEEQRNYIDVDDQ
jgi:hypothetical protein